jgi:ABC-type multidrug transport system ATPase subunit
MSTKKLAAASQQEAEFDSAAAVERQGLLKKWAVQYRILTKKNYIIFKRRWKVTALQVLSPLFFIFLIFVIDIGFNSSPTIRDRRATKKSYDIEPLAAIARCPNTPCTTIAYAPTGAPQDTFITNIAQAQGIPSAEIAGYASIAEYQSAVFNNQNKTQAAYLFYSPLLTTGSNLVIDYTIAYNDSITCIRPRVCTNPIYAVAIPMQVAMDAQLMQAGLGASLNVNLVKMPRKELLKLDVVGTFGQFFFFLSIMFLFLVFANLIIGEKESKLRLGLRVMGLQRLPYWMSWLTTALVMLLFCVLVLIASGAAFQFKFFLLNNFFLYFFLFMLAGFGILMMAFVLTTLIHRTKVATPIGFAFFLVFYIGNILAANIVYSPTIAVPEALRTICALLPPIVLAKGLNDLSAAVQSEGSTGISWADRDTYTDIYPMPKLYWFAAIDIAIYLVLLWYFDHVIGGEFGVGEKPWFFLSPSFYSGRKKQSTQKYVDKSEKDAVAESIYHEDPDVKAERETIENNSDPSRQLAVRVVGLQKFFPDGMCTRRGYKAVRGVSFGVNNEELFCLLGPNGAGKSTTFNMLTGVHSITSGEAYIKGFRVGEQMDEIQRVMGVCPQHDILWDDLTAGEHLELMAAMKGVRSDFNAREVTKRLIQVDLEDVRNVCAGNFSGGMQRRLSVAIALIASPAVVFLDEPTTGMDPVVRRKLWNMIEDAKKGCAIVLTTHSMEEADILGDRITILTKGRIRCIGSSLRLKQRFGAGYRLAFTADAAEKPKIKSWMTRALPTAALVGDVGTFLSYQVPRELSPQLGSFFEQLEQQREFSCDDYSLSMTTLEDVFIRISQESREDEAKYQEAKAQEKTAQ